MPPVRIAASCFGLPILALVGCAQTDTVALPPVRSQQPPPVAGLPPGVDREVQVGLLLPLSGPAEALGQDMLRAAEMALFDVGENEVVLLPRDTAGTPEGAAAAARGVLEEGADLIIGPLYRASVPAVAEVVRAHNAGTGAAGFGAGFGAGTGLGTGAGAAPATPGSPAAALAAPPGDPFGAARQPVKVLAFSNAADAAAPGVYLLGFRPEEQVERVVDYALAQGSRRIAGLAPDDGYGRVAMDALRAAVVSGGGELGPTRFYPPNADAIPSDIVREVASVDERLRNLEQRTGPDAGAFGVPPERALGDDPLGRPPFDAILLADGGNRLRSIASLLAYYDVDPSQVRFLGPWRWADEDPAALQDTALDGGWFAAPSPEGMEAFRRRFAATFGEEPEPLATLAYDATALAAIVARDAGGALFDDAALTAAEGFLGASGPFRLRPDGLAEHGLAVLEVDADGPPRVVSPTPSSFAPAEVAVRQDAPPLRP